MIGRAELAPQANAPEKSLRLSQTWIAILSLMALEVLFALLYRFGNLELHVIATIAVGLAAGIIYCIALYALEHSAERRAALWLVLAGALLFRLTLLPLHPTLSDDPYRYHWDGQVQLAGYNPYAVRPDTLAFGARTTPLGHPLPGHDVSSIYPPLSQLAFRLFARYLPGMVAFKLPFVLADLLVVFLLAGSLRSSPKRNFRLAVYAWNPLVIVEFAGTGHNDVLALAALLAAVLIIRSRIGVSTLALAAAALFKIFPILLFPLWLRRAGWPRSAVSWGAGFASLALAGLCFWPYRSALSHISGTLSYFASRWQNNNASLFVLLRNFSHSPGLAAGLGVGVVLGLSLWAAFRRLEPERAAYLIFGAILLFSPNAFPWYFTWIIPFLCFFPNPAWILLTILQFLSYHVLIGYGIRGQWQWDPFFVFLTYFPFYAMFLWEASKSAGQWRRIARSE